MGKWLAKFKNLPQTTQARTDITDTGKQAREPTYQVLPGVVVIYPRRPSCVEAGHCLQPTKELDCDLYPLADRPGWCRERVGRRSGEIFKER